MSAVHDVLESARRQRTTAPRAAGVALATALVATLALTLGSPGRLAEAHVLAAPSPEFFGVSPANDPSDAEVARMRAGGIGTLRRPFFWQVMQPTQPDGQPQNSFEWGRTDRLMTRAATHHLRVLPFVVGAPEWIADSTYALPLQEEQARVAWQNFLRSLAERYGPGGSFWRLFSLRHPGVAPAPITTWQIWNEPSSPRYRLSVSRAPERYATLVKISHEALESVNPGANVVLAGLNGFPRRGMRANRFLRRLYRVPGIETSFDAAALHPYSPGIRGVREQTRLVRRSMKRAGDGDTPLWITEVGWPTGGNRSSRMFKTYRGQKRMLRRTFTLFLERRHRWNLRSVIWYTWRDNDENPGCSLCRFSGLFKDDLTSKPAWTELVRITGGSP